MRGMRVENQNGVKKSTMQNKSLKTSNSHVKIENVLKVDS